MEFYGHPQISPNLGVARAAFLSQDARVVRDRPCLLPQHQFVRQQNKAREAPCRPWNELFLRDFTPVECMATVQHALATVQHSLATVQLELVTFQELSKQQHSYSQNR